MIVMIVIIRHELGLVGLFDPRLRDSLKVFHVYLMINMFINTYRVRVEYAYFRPFEIYYKYYRLF